MILPCNDGSPTSIFELRGICEMARRPLPTITDKGQANRRLVVVAAFDVVNFSALVEADEDNVLAAWRALRREIDPLIGSGGGRIFKSLGDGLLVEFTSPFDATRAAMEVQAPSQKRPPNAACALSCVVPSTWAK
jgi:class 3 adenylate cyclase